MSARIQSLTFRLTFEKVLTLLQSFKLLEATGFIVGILHRNENLIY